MGHCILPCLMDLFGLKAIHIPSYGQVVSSPCPILYLAVQHARLGSNEKKSTYESKVKMCTMKNMIDAKRSTQKRRPTEMHTHVDCIGRISNLFTSVDF